MIINGEKIYLRGIELSDSELLLSLINDPETESMLAGRSRPISREEQIKWQEKQYENNSSILRCIVSLKNSTKGIGTVILSDIDYINGTAEVHVKLIANEGRDKGYGTDVIKTIVKYAFNEMRLNCVFANILTYNNKSKHLFEKCGFSKEGILKSRIYKDGAYIDVYSYSLLQNDWLNNESRNRQ